MNFLIHIGHNKSASTYMQKRVFPKTPGLFFQETEHGVPLRQMIKARQEWDPTIIEQWLKEQKRLAEKQGNVNHIVISDEGLSGREHDYFTMSPIAVANNIKKIFPDAKILIFIRNQLSYLESLYGYRVSVKGREYRTFKKYLDDRLPDGLLQRLEYETLCRHYIQLFGRESVCIAPMELLLKDREKLFSLLSDFFANPLLASDTSKKVNSSTKSLFALNIFRKTNLLAGLMLRPLENKGVNSPAGRFYKRMSAAYNNAKGFIIRAFSGTLERTKPIRAEEHLEGTGVLETFRQTNRKLQEITGINLEELGYPS